MKQKSGVSPKIGESAIRKVKRLAWVIWIVVMVAQVFNMFHRIAVSAAVDRIMADLHITAATAGSMMAMYFYIYAGMQFPSGILADSLGSRKTVTLGCIIAGFGSVIFGFSPSVSMLYVGRFIVSLGVSVIFVNGLKIVTEWFEAEKFAFMASAVAIISTVGALFATTPMAFLVNSAGWRLSFEIVGIISFVIGIVCWMVIRNRPQNIGLPAPGGSRKKKESGTGGRKRPDEHSGLGKRILFLLKNTRIWPPFLLGMGFYGTLLVFQGAWGIPYLMQVYSMNRQTAANFILLTLLSHIAGLLIIPYFSGKIRRRKLPAVICSIGYLATWITLILWNGGKPPQPMLYPLCAAMGFFTAFMPLIYTCTKEVVSRTVSGMALGIVNMSPFLSAAIFQIFVGFILDARWEGGMNQGARIYSQAAFQAGFIAVGVGVIISLIGALLLKETFCRDISDA